MTFCLGITTEEGLVAIADTRITSGNEMITAQKMQTYVHENGAFFLMMSGLRSVRDKTITYFEDHLDDLDDFPTRMYEVANLFADKLRMVAKEDKEYLEEGGLSFNAFTLVGGWLRKDKEHKLFLIYPEGNWVEVTRGTPFHIIGEGGYGKPVLDRTLKYTDPINFALKVGCLAFDSTRISASDVDYPIDVVIYNKMLNQLVEHRYEKEDLSEISTWWQEHLRGLVHELPCEWVDNIAAKLTMSKRLIKREKGNLSSE